jgi:hypothetical protein
MRKRCWILKLYILVLALLLLVKDPQLMWLDQDMESPE